MILVVLSATDVPGLLVVGRRRSLSAPLDDFCDQVQ